MLSTKRGSKWCSCYGWLWVFPKPWYLNSSLRSTPGGRQRYFFIDSIQSVAVLFCSIWDDDDHQGHLGLKCRGAAEMCCIIGSTTHTGHFFHRNSRIAQDGWSWGRGGERLIDLKMFSRYDLYVSMYNVHNGQLATQRSRFYWQQMSPECGTSKTKAKLQERRKVQIQCVQCSAFKPICLNIVIGHPICQILCITAIYRIFWYLFCVCAFDFCFCRLCTRVFV